MLAHEARVFTSASGGTNASDSMRDLPPELATLDDGDLVVQRVARDERIAILFRKWPKLAGRELQELRRLYAASSARTALRPESTRAS
jgi:hypothetical protein